MLEAGYSSVPRIGPDYKNLAFLTITFLGLGLLIYRLNKQQKNEERYNTV